MIDLLRPPGVLTLFYCPECGFTTTDKYGCIVPTDGDCSSPERDVYRYELIKEADDDDE